MIKKLLQVATSQKRDDNRTQLYRNLMRHEAKIGGELFGPVPAGVRREFFCLDLHTWVWHEEWTDKSGNKQFKTTRYDVRPDTILKAQDDQPYQEISAEEAINLAEAVRLYVGRVEKELYSFG